MPSTSVYTLKELITELQSKIFAELKWQASTLPEHERMNAMFLVNREMINSSDDGLFISFPRQKITTPVEASKKDVAHEDFQDARFMDFDAYLENSVKTRAGCTSAEFAKRLSNVSTPDQTGFVIGKEVL